MSIFKTIADLAKLVIPGAGAVIETGEAIVGKFEDLIDDAKDIAEITEQEQSDLDEEISRIREDFNDKADETIERLRGN